MRENHPGFPSYLVVNGLSWRHPIWPRNSLDQSIKLTEGSAVKGKAPVVKQLYRLNVEPKAVDQLTKLASRTGEPNTRLAPAPFTQPAMRSNPPANPRTH